MAASKTRGGYTRLWGEPTKRWWEDCSPRGYFTRKLGAGGLSCKNRAPQACRLVVCCQLCCANTRVITLPVEAPVLFFSRNTVVEGRVSKQKRKIIGVRNTQYISTCVSQVGDLVGKSHYHSWHFFCFPRSIDVSPILLNCEHRAKEIAIDAKQ